MSENRRNQEGYCWRKGDWVFCRLSTSEVNKLNEQVKKIHQEVSDEMGIRMNRMERPSISEQIMVFNVTLEECHQVLVHHVNRRSITAPLVGELVKLSEQRFAPYCARELQLATPAHYRRSDSLDSEIVDPNDGLLTKDATPWMRQSLASRVGPIQSLNATLTFSSPDEPWVYCTSISPASSRETKGLRTRFPKYDAMTVIKDPDSFATQLGIDFAISFKKSTHVELGPIEELAYRRSRYSVSFWEGEHRIDKFIRVYHGPVVYEDQSGVLGSVEDVVDFSMVPKGWFTKKTRFSGEREYRFAVSTLGKPRMDTFKLRISDELRRLTAKA